MTIDPTFSVSTLPKIAQQDSDTSSSPLRPSPQEQEQWKKLRKRVQKRRKSSPPRSVLTSAKSGAAYRWGVAASLETSCPELIELLSRIATDSKVSDKRIAACDLSLAAEQFCDQRPGAAPTPIDDAVAVIWAAAMPGLSDHLETRIWWDLLGKLQLLSEHARESDDNGSPARLLLGGEVGLTLAWRLTDLPSCRRLRDRSVKAVKSWLESDAEAIAGAVQGVRDSRLVLASAVRCDDLIRHTTKHKLARKHQEIIAELATWVGGLTNPGGAAAFSPSQDDDRQNGDERTSSVPQSFADDLSLLRASFRFDEETLRPAIEAALGATQTGGRLAWEVCLPESLIHCEDAKVAVMMPEWDVRRGRTLIDYGGEDCRIELHAGRRKAFTGTWQAMITVDGDEHLARGPWESTCEFTDDDVHYIELEQPWSGGVTLQRQIVVIRDDRCVLLADNVLLDEPGDGDAAKTIQYTGRLPLTNELIVDPESETRELFLRSSTSETKHRDNQSKKSKANAPSVAKAQALAIPLAASEWRIGPTTSQLSASDDNHLILSETAVGGLHAPMWLDLSPRRFKRKRTWRQLTVADDLRVSRRDEAVAFRLQIGSEHWLVYRSLGESRVRSVLGKHLIADFFAARFHPGDGGLEELVTVECNDEG